MKVEVKFKKSLENLFDIKFNNKQIQILLLIIDNHSDFNFKNIITLKQYGDNYLYYFIDCVNFMDYLINSSKDIELLCLKGILEHYFFDDGSN